MKDKNIGIVFGCFIPLHRGHMSVLADAIYENDHTIIGVTGHDQDRGKDFIPFLRRLRMMHTLYDNSHYVTVVEIDDKKLGLTGTFSEEAWRIWSEELFQNAERNPYDDNVTYHWYTGEESYVRKLKTIYPRHRFHLADRSKIKLSGTDIRNHPENHREDIHPLFLDYLVTMGILPNT